MRLVLKNHSLFELPIIIQNKITRIKVVPVYYIQKRDMMRASCYSAARIAYYAMKLLANLNATNDLNTNQPILIEQLVNYGLDNQCGIIPHKSILLKHIFAGKHPISAELIYKNFQEKIQIPSITCIPAITNTRIIAELPVLSRYYETFGNDINSIHVNNDSCNIPLATIPGQQQTNHDWYITLQSTWNNLAFSQHKSKVLLNDQKSCTGMFEHSTSGTIGIMYYDENNKPILFMNKLYTLQELIEHDKKNLRSIFQATKHDGLNENFAFLEKDASNMFKDSNIPFELRHNQYQHYIWEHLQRNSSYNRMLSFIFIEKVDLNSSNDKLNRFAKEFKSQLGSKLYNLDQRGDCKEITHAMLKAYQKTIDLEIINKLNKLHIEGTINYNKNFIQDISSLLKKYVFYT